MLNGRPSSNPKLNRKPKKPSSLLEPAPSSPSTSTGLLLSPTAHIRSRLATMISPRSSNYERLEGGMGPSRTGAQKRRFGWKKFAIGAVVIIALVYFFGPRASKKLPWKSAQNPGYEPDTAPLPPPPEEHKKPSPPKQPSKPTVDHPTSYETDPDPSSTTHCTRPHTPSTPLVQYALMIDAGSTGSRIHIYKFNNCGPSAAYEYETFKMIQGGLSSYAGRPTAAAESLDVLLKEALRVVPKAMYACSPVAVKATAGLRLLPGSQSHDILKAVEERLHSHFPFPLPPKQGVVIMEGKDEGVFAWITANYLLGALSASPASAADTPTYAVLDLGGASTQIVFKPQFTKKGAKLEDGEHKYELRFGGRTHVLYQHSYLGYGLMRARAHVHSLVDFMASLRVGSSHTEGGEEMIANPCLARGTQRTVPISDTRNVTMTGADVGSFEACDRIMQLVLAKDALCEMKPCSFNGVYQPSLLDAFERGKVLLLSYFYDRMAPLLPPSDSSSPQEITVNALAEHAQLICAGPPSWSAHPLWSSSPPLLAELAGRPEWCLDLVFMHALLRMGYGFGEGREVRMAKKVGGTELGWCLGAAIGMVGGEVVCRDGEGVGEGEGKGHGHGLGEVEIEEEE